MHLHLTVQNPIYIISFIIPVKAFTTLKRFKKAAFYSPRHSTSRNSLPTDLCVTLRDLAQIYISGSPPKQSKIDTKSLPKSAASELHSWSP